MARGRNNYILNNKKSRSISWQAFLEGFLQAVHTIGAAITRMRASAQMLAVRRCWHCLGESLDNAHVQR